MDNKKVQLGRLKIREKAIISRSKYKTCPGVLNKVQRQIKTLEKEV